MQTAHRIELKPNNRQRTYFAKASGVARFAYNWGLAEWNRLYEENKNLPEEARVFISGMMLKKRFNAIKKEQYPWTKEVTKYAAQQPFLDLQKAFQSFFAKTGMRPKFKKKGHCRDSFYVGGDQIKVLGQKIHVPNLGLVRMKEGLRFLGKINSATFSKQSDKWFVSIQVETVEKEIIYPQQDRAVGIDLGITSLMVTSDGHNFHNERPLQKSLKKLKKEQRRLSKKKESAKKRGSNLKDCKNYQKQKIKVSKIHYKVYCQRDDILHKVTSSLACNYHSIAIEDLNVKGMVKNHNLARHIQDVGFGKFRILLKYKTGQRCSDLILVNRFYPSSKTCFKCKKIKEHQTLADRTFSCECGWETSRDFNASLNLKSQIGRVPAELTPVEITALQKSVRPVFVTSIGEAGSKHQITLNQDIGKFE